MDGWLILDKPVGITSARAVATVKRILRPKKIGHAGTLDPLASGILPLALGQSTKTVSYVMADEKEYIFTAQWGEARGTDDLEGEVTAYSDARPTRKQIESLLPEFTGVILQTPPAYSAIKLGGRRAYARAREGQAVEIAPRRVEIKKLEILEYQNDSTAFRVTCGKGTYIRSLARELGERLGCFGHVSALRRTRVGKFGERQAISLAELEKFGHIPPPVKGLWSIESVLDDIPALKADRDTARKLKAGLFLPLAAFSGVFILEEGQIVTVLCEGTLQALAKVENNLVKPVRVFNFEE